MLTENRVMQREATIQSKAAEKIIKAAARTGVSADSLCDAAGLEPAALKDSDHRIPFAKIVLLYEKAAELTKDDAFGLHIGENVDPNAFDVLGYSVINSPTFGAALNRVVRYNFIWTNGSTFEVLNGASTTRVVYKYLDPSLKQRRQDAEMSLAAIASLGRRVTGVEWFPNLVSFEHPAPANTSEHQRIFGCEVLFATENNEFIFDSRVLNLPIIKADPGLCAVLDRHAEDLLSRFPAEQNLIDLARATITKELRRGDASLEQVAAEMGMSSRTVQRKLRQHGTSHQKLLDEVRKDLAVRFLREPEMAICEVAYLLGFSESSALHRAFKRWTGSTPNEFRRRSLNLSHPQRSSSL